MELRRFCINFIFYCLCNSSIGYSKFVSRREWGGRAPTDVERLNGEIPYVVIHHSAAPGACYTETDCQKAMRDIQDLHQLQNGWDDIGYNFAVGGDGNIYEGRGFNVVGAHARGYNRQSVGICLIGDWTEYAPPKIMLDRTSQLIQYGIKMNRIRKDYRLFGHRQLSSSSTECPGNALFNLIQKWKHFSQP